MYVLNVPVHINTFGVKRKRQRKKKKEKEKEKRKKLLQKYANHSFLSTLKFVRAEKVASATLLINTNN